ncbi:nucleotidyltransferase family protein [Spelaeicoccus albus]
MAPRPSIVLARHRAEILGVVKQHKARDVRVFGSIRRGENTSGSDIDLLVTFKPDADILDLPNLTEALTELTRIHVGVVSEGGLRSDYDRIAVEATPL